MQVELIADYEGVEIYGIVEYGFSGNTIHYEGSKVEVLCFYLGMVGPQAYA